jgi:hypothetical protein
MHVSATSLPYPLVLHLQIQPITHQKYSRRIPSVLNMCRLFLILWTRQYNNYFSSIYTILGLLNQLEMIYSIWEDVQRFYENMMPFDIQGMSWSHIYIHMYVCVYKWSKYGKMPKLLNLCELIVFNFLLFCIKIFYNIRTK